MLSRAPETMVWISSPPPPPLAGVGWPPLHQPTDLHQSDALSLLLHLKLQTAKIEVSQTRITEKGLLVVKSLFKLFVKHEFIQCSNAFHMVHMPKWEIFLLWLPEELWFYRLRGNLFPGYNNLYNLRECGMMWIFIACVALTCALYPQNTADFL